MAIFEHVHLAYLPSREGGWDTRKEWKDVLSYVIVIRCRAKLTISGGEKQRVSGSRAASVQAH
jgi:hypothetical protein